MKRRLTRLFRAIVLIVAVPIITFLALILFFKAGRASDFRSQDRRLSLLSSAEYAEDPNLSPSPESILMATRHLSDRVNPAQLALLLPFNRLSVIGSHNSYHRQADPLRLFLLGLGSPGMPEKLKYGHETLYDQLRAGVRSLELDVRLRSGRFEVTHVPLVDDRSTCPDLGQAFEEISLWSARHPDHLPVTILIELKEDWKILDPALEDIDGGALVRLDGLIRSTIPAGILFEPDELRGSYETLPDSIRERGWPPILDMLGRILIVLHENDAYRAAYLATGPNLSGRAMFTCAPPGNPDSAFAILNDPFDPRIPEYLAQGMLVRTRADADLARDAESASRALESGAQIVSTDYPPESSPAPAGKESRIPLLFGNGTTALIRP